MIWLQFLCVLLLQAGMTQVLGGVVCHLTMKRGTTADAPLYFLVRHILGTVILAIIGILVFGLNIPNSAAFVFFWPIFFAALILSIFLKRKELPPWAPIRRSGTWFIENRILFAPVLFALFISAFFFFPFGPELLKTEVNWHHTSSRLYPLNDSALQFWVSNNFFFRRPIENGFHLSNWVWSAGDRPMLMALLDATSSLLTGEKELHLNHYSIRIFYSVAVLIVPFFVLFGRILRQPIKTVALVFAAMTLHPFFLTNFQFTWPKAAGTSFFLCGLVLGLEGLEAISPARRNLHPKSFLNLLWISSGLALAFSLLCHETLIFGVAAALTFLTWKSRPLSLGLARNLKKEILIVCFSFIFPLSIHSIYVKTHTTAFGLLKIAAFCREGSFSFKNEPTTLVEACIRYYHRAGPIGIVRDHLSSLGSAFVSGWSDIAIEAHQLLSGQWQDLINSYYYNGRYVPIFAYGFWNLPLLGVVIATIIFRRKAVPPHLKDLIALYFVGFIFLFLFAASMSESSEVTAMQIPLTQQILVFSCGLFLWAHKFRKIISAFIALYSTCCIVMYYYCDSQILKLKINGFFYFMSYFFLIASIALMLQAPLFPFEKSIAKTE
ncbi:hypothetical protein WDW86_00790 [Bdellovibrionota bacterium FG-2]